MKITALILVVAFCSLVQSSQPGDLKPIFDARLVLTRSALGDAEKRLFNDQILPASRNALRSRQKDCSGDPEAMDVAAGSFTASNRDQKAILYSYCNLYHNADINGIAIIDGGEIAAHVVFESNESAIGALDDINQNGRQEILLFGGGGNQGQFYGWVSLVELSTAGVTKLGKFEVSGAGCGQDIVKEFQYSKRLLARKGPAPEFFAERFDKDCKTDNGPWIKKGTAQRVQLDKDEAEYRAVR